MALRTTRGLDDDAKLAEWRRVVDRIVQEQWAQGSRHRTFREFRAVFVANPALVESAGFLFNWAAQNYIDAALMLLRRELDLQAGTENLRNLLLDIIESPQVLTRARYVSLWGDVDARHPERPSEVFDTFAPKKVAGHSDRDFIDPEVVQRDLDELVARVEHVREYAERTRANPRS